MERQIKLTLFNLEGVTSMTILSVLAGEIEAISPDFAIFTNVWMEPHFPKILVHVMKKKGYVSGQFSPSETLSAREILFRKKSIPAGKIINTTFDRSHSGFRTYIYQLPIGESSETRKVIIKTFTFDEEIEGYLRASRIKHLMQGETNIRVPEIIASDFRIFDWEHFETPKGWVDLYDLVGSAEEDCNYDQSRRDRIWFREGSAKVESLRSAIIQDIHNKLDGEKKLTVGTLTFRD